MKLKSVVAAVALATAGTANATVELMSSGDSSLFFSVRDNVNAVSYVRDLDRHVSDMSTSDVGPIIWAADANMTSFLAGGSGDYSWAVQAGDTTDGTMVGNITYLSTSTTSSPVVTAGEMANMVIFDTDYFANVKPLIASGGSVVSGSQDSAYFDTTADTWSQGAPFDATKEGFGEVGFYEVVNNVSLSNNRAISNPQDVTEFVGTWKFSSDGALEYSAVPVPAAVWLLGSALLGLVGISRRRAAIAA
jgi:hypothetical protein